MREQLAFLSIISVFKQTFVNLSCRKLLIIPIPRPIERELNCSLELPKVDVTKGAAIIAFRYRLVIWIWLALSFRVSSELPFKSAEESNQILIDLFNIQHWFECWNRLLNLKTPIQDFHTILIKFETKSFAILMKLFFKGHLPSGILRCIEATIREPKFSMVICRSIVMLKNLCFAFISIGCYITNKEKYLRIQKL